MPKAYRKLYDISWIFVKGIDGASVVSFHTTS